MSNKRNIAILAAVAAALISSEVLAEEQSAAQATQKESPTTGKTVAEIVAEARARVEGDRQPADWRIRQDEKKHEEKKQDEEEQDARPLTYYIGFTGENPPSMSLRAMYDQRAAQRAAAPLQYLEPMTNERDKDNEGASSLFAGVGLTDRLEVEFRYSEYSRRERGSTRVIDPTLTGTQAAQASQGSEYSGAEYSAALLAHWRFHQLWSVYGRIGIGYAETMLRSTLGSSGRTTSEEHCVPQNDGTTKCSTIYHHASSDWGTIRDGGQGFYPIIGGGIEFVRAFRLEFTYRPFVPIANTTTDVLSNFMISIRLYNTDWLVMK